MYFQYIFIIIHFFNLGFTGHDIECRNLKILMKILGLFNPVYFGIFLSRFAKNNWLKFPTAREWKIKIKLLLLQRAEYHSELKIVQSETSALDNMERRAIDVGAALLKIHTIKR